MLGGHKLTNELPNRLNQEPCMEAGTLPKNDPTLGDQLPFLHHIYPTATLKNQTRLEILKAKQWIDIFPV